MRATARYYYLLHVYFQYVLDDEEGTADTATSENSLNSLHKHGKDSGVGRTDDSTKNDESSEHVRIPSLDPPGFCSFTKFTVPSLDLPGFFLH